MNKTNNVSSLWFGLLLYWGLVLFLLVISLKINNGFFGYPIDDTYIHMAMGKHHIMDGYWGVSQFGFSSSTSSPLWTFLITVSYMVFGVNEYSPFLLALIPGTLIIFYSHSILSTKLDAFRLKISLSAIIIFTPLAMLTLSGMEHILHAYLTIILLFTAIEYLDNFQASQKSTLLMILISAVITITRYEGLFLIFSLCLILLLQRRLIQSILIGAAGLLPIIVYGLFSISKGWMFLPNSVLLKGNSLQFSLEGFLLFFQRLLTNILLAPHIFILLLASIGVFFWAKQRQITSNKEKYLTTLYVMTGYLHMQFAGVGWFYRYDAYLVLTGILLIAWIAAQRLKTAQSTEQGNLLKNSAFLLLGVLLIMPLTIRAAMSHSQYPTATKNIHDQQSQMALFITKYYGGSVIAANDIGAINYIADVKTLDLFGLASLDVAQAKRNGNYDADTIQELVLDNGVEIIVIYDAWFKDNRPSEWIEVGKWKITNNVVCADDTVTFYVPNELFKSKAVENLKEFSIFLPNDVEQSGLYTDH